MSAPLPKALRARFQKLVEEGLKRFQFMLDRQYPATPSALSGHWRYPCCTENWKRYKRARCGAAVEGVACHRGALGAGDPPDRSGPRSPARPAQRQGKA